MNFLVNEGEILNIIANNTMNISTAILNSIDNKYLVVEYRRINIFFNQFGISVKYLFDKLVVNDSNKQNRYIVQIDDQSINSFFQRVDLSLLKEIQVTYETLEKETLSRKEVIRDYSLRNNDMLYIMCTDFKNIKFDRTINSFKRLVIDLRFNCGGSLKEALRFLGYFKSSVKIKCFSKNKEAFYIINRAIPVIKDELNIYVFIGNETRSSAEIVANELSTLKNVCLIGDKTYGKNIIQKRKELDENIIVHMPIYEVLYHTGYSYVFPNIYIEIKKKLEIADVIEFVEGVMMTDEV